MTVQPEITPDTIVRQAANIISSPVGNDIAILHLDKNRYYGLEAISALIWQLVAQPIKVSAICTQLQHNFDITAEQCEIDVLEFLNRAYAEDLVAIADSSAT